MSGTALSILLGSAPATQDVGSSLLSALYGTSSAASGNPISALQSAEKNQTIDIAAEAKQTSVARDIAAFTAGIASAKTPDALLSNPAVLKVLLTANGLGDQVGYPALAKQALLSNPANTTALANQLSNTAWKTTASTYQFATAGLSIIQQPAVQAKLASAYAEVLWRQSLDAANPGLSNALTFRAEASTITGVDQVLGDPILRDVVTTTLGLPLEIAFQPLQTQEKAITSRLDLATFKDPATVERFTQQYLIAKAQAPSTTTAPTLDILAVQAAGLVV